LLAVLPSLVYLISDAGGKESVLQQSLDTLLAPIYVVIDTLRPLVDVGTVLDLLELDDIEGLTLFKDGKGIGLDVMKLLEGLLAGDPPADDPPAADRAPSADQPTGTDQPPSDAVAPSPQEADSVDARSLIDALDNLPVPGQAASDGRSLTAEAHRRLTSLARVLRHLRSVTYLSLPELVVAAERSLGLDVEVATVAALAEVIAPEHAERLSTRGRSHLDAFRDVAANFARSTEQATLGAFLAWLAAAAREENGLDRPLHDPDPDAVQIITAHGAKGLEWDVVAVPGLSDGVFPADPERAGGRTDAGWLTNARTLPYPLRGDAADLPPFAWERFTDTKELAEGQQAFRLACGAHQFAEERRLAYVAFTRARTELLLLGHYWGDPKAPRPLSPFLGELLEAGLVAPEPDWADPPGEGVENPRLAAQTVVLWPRGSDLVAGRLAAGDAAMGDAAAPASPQHLLARAAQRVREATSALPDDELGAQTALLLAERQRQPAAQVMLPAHLSASALVRLAADREEFARQLRRPLPAEPTVAARRGTEFHAWVEQFYSRPALLDLDDFDLDDFDLDDPRRAASAGLDLTALKAAFESSAWAGLQPVAIEVDVETPLAGVMTRCRMDAVFPDPDGAPGAQIVVDWKTGHPPSNPADQRAREVQLAVYRLAWSRFTGLPLAQVSAAFHYVGSDTTVRPARLSTEAELEALIKG
ncbi:MAG: PD-(D/E)XK nuclease family protein, partial [Promicromonosporaceae bacterium]|nr:PD-(D/E)XK nuclease family protein [Promicromonosporaceae bacterium]